MISKKFNLEGKIVIPILLKNETGRPVVSGSFYVYEDEKLAKEHLKTAIFARIEKAKGAGARLLAGLDAGLLCDGRWPLGMEHE